MKVSVASGSIFAGTDLLALLCMWIGAMVTDALVDQRGAVGVAAE